MIYELRDLDLRSLSPVNVFLTSGGEEGNIYGKSEPCITIVSCRLTVGILKKRNMVFSSRHSMFVIDYALKTFPTRKIHAGCMLASR
jgi:hypothetical protein